MQRKWSMATIDFVAVAIAGKLFERMTMMNIRNKKAKWKKKVLIQTF